MTRKQLVMALRLALHSNWCHSPVRACQLRQSTASSNEISFKVTCVDFSVLIKPSPFVHWTDPRPVGSMHVCPELQFNFYVLFPNEYSFLWRFIFNSSV